MTRVPRRPQGQAGACPHHLPQGLPRSPRSRTADRPVAPATRQRPYHPDRQGSSRDVTDPLGQLFQHTEFFPYGETWVKEKSNIE
ncbi:MAG TPA: hypothetical protein VFM54_05255, partial [Micromonosporaceae bacterium]|nr:hypothetical protein [Micromonosporaceae bacterium]